ncbi:TMAO/DMSO reductase [Vibrio neptunius]|uniref:protein-methionine-sulfoxide reductase catalytic subunit MsrP n=1 Tax=Vibrio neptunius TaxID=170651 RepID=UPI0005FA74C4|nr:protein-methionine-sulfoxide reductase catalytic subunit MsrP [Vibrio neptunius]KJY94261.1 TMAO/DMSO reductase [Vibrio neptunius]
MWIKKKYRWAVSENEATPESVYKERRDILKKLGIAVVGVPLAANSQAGVLDLFSSKEQPVQDRRIDLSASKPDKYQADLSLTPQDKVLKYNNFYEFGTGKSDPAEKSGSFVSDPWSVKVDGLVGNPITLNYEDIFNKFTLEERIYRLRCVEAWSMNIPWIGFPLSEILKMANPKSEAKYVAFETLYDPEQFPGQNSWGGSIDYPYVEGLRLDEAMNPLTLISVGLYGKTLAPQNGAPLRLVVPWKYGFKSIKSIVRIRLTDQEPPTTWNRLAPHEYGFYANVNPQVDHPRWSQASERFIGEGNLFSSRRQPTLMFNGYEEEVAHLYENMDLRKFY